MGKFWAGQPLWIARTGERKQKGDDGGCFAAALESVRRFGGVLEHPWGSHAWPHFGVAVPQRSGGWVKADEHGGYTCCVEQGRYGHYARKPTLLYAVGTELPELRWAKARRFSRNGRLRNTGWRSAKGLASWHLRAAAKTTRTALEPRQNFGSYCWRLLPRQMPITLVVHQLTYNSTQKETPPAAG